MKKNRVILGIFGGMGPDATAELYRNIIRITPAKKDQDHIPMLIYSLPQVPERSAAIRTGDRTIIPYLTEGVTRLEKAGASCIAVPCNTVHFYYDEMQKAVQVPVINMIRETAAETRARQPETSRVGLLATTGTLESKLYEIELKQLGITTVVPDDSVEIDLVMEAVFLIKSGAATGRSRDLLSRAARHLVDKGAEAIILGCTEIPLGFDPGWRDVPVIDAGSVLAQKAVAMYANLAGHAWKTGRIS